MEKKPKKGFLYWYENVFKYHYGKLTIILVLLAIVVVFNIVDARRTKIDFDFNMVIAVSGAIPKSATAELEEVAGNIAGDINGDGEININIQIVDMSTGGEESPYRLMLLMSLPENVVFLMDDHFSAVHAKDFNNLDDYGIVPDEDYSQRVYVGDTPIMDRINPDIEFYACLADWTTDGKGNPLWTEVGVELINAIINSQ